MPISLGKLRGLYQSATPRGVFCVLALDHRGNLRRAINPQNPESVADPVLIELKRQVALALAPASSAVLIDPQTGGGECLAEGCIPGGTGLIWTLDETGYSGEAQDRKTLLVDGWSVEKAKRLGASGVKLLTYYHPDAESAADQRDLIEEIAEQAIRADTPFFLEPLSFSLDPSKKKLPSAEREQVVIRTAQELSGLGVDIFKVEFPVDAAEVRDERRWLDACSALNAASQVPWLLLSAGVDFETYLRQVEVACRAGASGVMAGRAVWKEAVELEGRAQKKFLHTTARERMLRLLEVCNRSGKPFWERVERPEITSEWYKEY